MIVVKQGPLPDGVALSDDTEESTSEVRNPTVQDSRLISVLDEYGRRLRELEKPNGAQLTQAIQKVLDISENIDQTVSDAINRTSYDKATIDAKVLEWNWGVLAPARGGTGTTNAYSNVFSTGSWRATWALSDGTLGTAQSSRTVKTDFNQPDIGLEDLLKVDWIGYRYIDDVNQNGDSAVCHVGMIAEELDDAGLGVFVEYNDDYEPVGINYPMLGVWAIHEAHLAHKRLDELEQQLKGLTDSDVEE